jgi:shikimate dehydrogenase
MLSVDGPEGARARGPRHGGRLGTWPGAATVVAGVIGDPVTHSLSPALHNAAFVELGLDWVYVAFPVPAGRGREAVAAMTDLGIRGLSVTMPHKAAAAEACHRLSPLAQRLGVVNTVTNVGGVLLGDSTDGPGFIDSLADQGWSAAGKRCLVLGSGGAARATVLALAEAGASWVGVVARREAEAEATAALAGAVGAVSTVAAVSEADLVVNATPVGMSGPLGMVGLTAPHEVAPDAAELPFGLEEAKLGPGQLVVDLIYAPATTPLMAAARRRGAEAVNGLGMLIHQAAHQVRRWTGRDAPVEVMSAAALNELRKRAEAGAFGPVSSTSPAKLPK